MPERVVDRTLAQRREFKYRISEAAAAEVVRSITPFMRPDAYAGVRPGKGYRLASLYLDTPDLRLFRQTVAGEKIRFKLRIRTYSDEVDAPVYFEIKRRVDQILMKKRAQVERSAIRRLLQGGAPRASDTADLDNLAEFLRLTAEIGAAPVTRVRYRREAFECVLGEPLRITLDRNLAFVPTTNDNVSLNGAGWRKAKIDGVILEIKFTGRHPQWLERMARRLELGRLSIPKYVISVSQARGLYAGGADGWKGRV